MDRRTQARELAMQALFQLDVQGTDAMETLHRFFRERAKDQLVSDLARDWTRHAWENIEQCDQLIKSAAIKWELSRLSQVDRAVLRLAAYQLRFCEDIPGKVVINEAIEMAKKYSGENSPGFVNGVLDAIMKKLRQENIR